MSSSDDDNDFLACWNKGLQCEMFKNSGWPRVFITDFNIAKSLQSPFTDLPQQIDFYTFYMKLYAMEVVGVQPIRKQWAMLT